MTSSTSQKFCTITLTLQWARWRFKSPASRLLTQPFNHASIKENIKTPRHCPLWGEFTGDQWISCTKASNTENISSWWRHHAWFALCCVCCGFASFDITPIFQCYPTGSTPQNTGPYVKLLSVIASHPNDISSHKKLSPVMKIVFTYPDISYH